MKANLDAEDLQDGAKPSTAKSTFDPMTLWKMKELKNKIKVRKQTFIFVPGEEPPEPPQV